MEYLLFSNQLHALKALSGDAAVGHVDEFYFDDQTWKIRYLVLDVGSWLTGRKVLISPAALGKIDWDTKALIIKATREQIEKSPEASTDLPVARALEAQIHMHYGWDFYWPEIFVGEGPSSQGTANKEHDPHLRSTRVLTGISVVAPGGVAFGKIGDFTVDPGTWHIPFVAVQRARPETVLIRTDLVRSIDVARREVSVALQL